MKRKIAEKILGLFGWKVVMDYPEDLEKCVVVGAPHTSTWDFPITLLTGAVLEFDFYWVAKKEMFPTVLAPLMKKLGGIPIDREGRHNYVDQLAKHFQQKDRLALMIAPEGTRSKTDRWKSGFYYIAKAAKVPIAVGFLDYARREAGISGLVDSNQTKEEVLQQLHEAYEDRGFPGNPDQYTPPIAARN